MKKELELWQFVAAKLERNVRVTLLVVVESKGSSPGRQGFKMAVSDDDMCGSIGGGVMEMRLVEGARGEGQGTIKPKIQNPKPKIVDQVHRKNAENSSGMICSGKQTVIFRELKKGDLKTVEKIISALEKHEEKLLRISADEFKLLEATGSRTDHKFEIFSLEAVSDRYQTKGGRRPPLNQTESYAYEERFGYKNHLYIVGGGHCALALSELMSKLDFHISLFDDRPKLNTLKKNEFAHEKKIIDSYEQIAGNIPSGLSNYVVVMTLGYKSDETVIRALANKKFKYFGVLGSTAKMKMLLRSLEKEGFSKKYLDSIRTPIGLKINSRTPEEIAVSIAAEIIAVKNFRK